MYSNRPYRNRMNFEKAVSIIQEVSGTQLTSDVVDAFMRLVAKGKFRAADGTHAGGTYAVEGGRLVFTLTDGTVAEPVTAENGDAGYTLGEMKFVLTAEFIARVEDSFRAWKSQVIPAIYNY